MGKKNEAPPPPDYGPLAAASQKSAEYSFELGKQQLAWAKQQDAQNQATSRPVIDAFLKQQQINDATAQQDRARYQTQFQPLEDKLATDAASYASPERQLQEAGKAEAGVTQQFDVQRDAAQRNLESFGIDPSSTRFAALDRGAGTAQAAATAGAGNQAIDQTVQRGMALRSEAINVGRGYPGQIAQQYSTAGQGGSGAINTGLQTTASGANTMGTTPQYQALGNSALSGWGNTLNTGYQNQLAQFNANQNASSGWGSALGLAGGIAASFIKVGEGGAIPVSPQDTVPQNVVPQEASPTSGKAIDDVPARLTVGEFVLPKDVVAWEGEKSLQGLITKAREASAKAKQQVQGQPVMGRGIPQAPTYISPSVH